MGYCYFHCFCYYFNKLYSNMLTKTYNFRKEEEMLGWERKLVLKQMSVITVGKQTTKSSMGIVPSINIFISICCGLQILKASVYASLEFRCVLCYMCMVVLGTKSFFSLFLFLVFFLFCCFHLTGTQSYWICNEQKIYGGQNYEYLRKV